MYKKGIYKVTANTPLTREVYRMVLEGDTQWIKRPGQFVNIELEGLYLRRPISICDWDEKSITIIYKVVGKGTEQMKRMQPGVELDVLTGLGNGFNPDVESLSWVLCWLFRQSIPCGKSMQPILLIRYGPCSLVCFGEWEV